MPTILSGMVMRLAPPGLKIGISSGIEPVKSSLPGTDVLLPQGYESAPLKKQIEIICLLLGIPMVPN